MPDPGFKNENYIPWSFFCILYINGYVISLIDNWIPFIRFTNIVWEFMPNKAQTIMYKMHTLTEEEDVM